MTMAIGAISSAKPNYESVANSNALPIDIPEAMQTAVMALQNARSPVEAGTAMRALDAAMPPQTGARSLVGTVTIDRTTNRDGSVTVTRSRILEAADVSIPTPHGPVQFPLATRREPMGSIRLMPQRTANGAPATLTPAMQTRLLNLSAQIGSEIRVSSGVRSQTQQEALRGNNPNTVATTSQHSVGDAADISVVGMSGRALARHAVQAGLFERVNLYPTGAVHVDQRDVGPGTQYYEDWARR